MDSEHRHSWVGLEGIVSSKVSTLAVIGTASIFCFPEPRTFSSRGHLCNSKSVQSFSYLSMLVSVLKTHGYSGLDTSSQLSSGNDFGMELDLRPLNWRMKTTSNRLWLWQRSRKYRVITIDS
jgi:hypothetical protein